MVYSVKEIFPTLQGEGAHSGRRAVFCRFTGCNLWNGLERDRADAVCKICDTDFLGFDGKEGGKYQTANALADKIAEIWRQGLADTQDPHTDRYVIFTGGEPLLQLDEALIKAVKAQGFEIGVESNGTIKAPDGIDWLCISPKTSDIVQKSGNEIKLLYPLAGLTPDLFADLDFEQFYLQPIDDPKQKENMAQTVAYCMAYPKWKLSLQTHKIAGIE